MTDTLHAARAIRLKSSQLGFERTGFAPADPPDELRRFEKWLADGMHADMAWMEKGRDKRLDPRKILPGARTIIVVTLSYDSPAPDPGPATVDPLSGFVARYARGDDYHVVMGRRLSELESFIEEMAPGHSALSYVDTGPILERLWAARSGIGWIGKNALVLNKDMGSYFFLGVVLTTLELSPDEPAAGQCGSCTLCIEACPTRAIVEPGVVDSRKCISYHTIELRGSLPDEHRTSLGSRLFGCDDCQEVCPWNQQAAGESPPPTAFPARPGSTAPSLVEILAMSRARYTERFRGSAMKRATYTGLRRNAAATLGNVACALREDGETVRSLALESLDEAGTEQEPDPVVREQAAWSASRLRRR